MSKALVNKVNLNSLPQDAGSSLVGYLPAGTGAVATTVQAKLRQTTSVFDFMTAAQQADVMAGTASVGVTAAIQAAHDALPSTGGDILFNVPGLYLLETSGTYVNITKPNVTIRGSSGAWVVSANSADAEVTTGSSILNGFWVTGNNAVISVNMRGPSIGWVPGSATDRLTVRDMKMLNLYNSGIAISSVPFDMLDVLNVEFNTSRALASDLGNYEAISRSCNGDISKYGKLVRVMGCLFKGVSGGVDVHNVRHTVIGGGTRFEGCDIQCIKLATADGVVVKQDLTVDETVTFDGAALNTGSANRHLACTYGSGFTGYLGFIQVFDKVDFHGAAFNFGLFGLAFLDGSRTNAIINLDNAEFEACPAAVVDVQGTVSMIGMRLKSANVYATNISITRQVTVARCRMIDSYIALSKRVFAIWSPIYVLDNIIDYSVNNLAPIRLVNYGVDNGPAMVVDRNIINVTGAGNTLCIDGSTYTPGSSTAAWVGANNVLSATAGTPTKNGNAFTAFEPTKTSGYSGSLNIPFFREGEVTVVNTNSLGAITYQLSDASSPLVPVGTTISFFRTHAANAMAVVCATGINGLSTLTLTTQYSGATLKKISANTFILVSGFGTYTLA
jgi:hypothetical protein